MRAKKIVWDDTLDSKETKVFNTTVDDTDSKVFKKKHPRYNQDRTQCSNKIEHGALKYEIAIAVHRAKIVWLNGPYQGGMNNISIFNHKLRKK